MSAPGIATRVPGHHEIPRFQRGRGTLGRKRFASVCSALARSSWMAIGALRGVSRLLQLGPLLVIALADAAIVRMTAHPTAPAVARSRAAWLHRWSRVVCSAMGLQVERRGFVPVSGVVIVSDTGLMDALALSSIAPFVFVVDMKVLRRPFIGWLARFAGARFYDDRRPNDVERIHFMIERALQRRQLVVVFEPQDPLREPGFLPGFILAAGAQCSLTRVAIDNRAISRGRNSTDHDVAAAVMTQPRRIVAVTFHAPSLRLGGPNYFASKLWPEERILEQTVNITLRIRSTGDRADPMPHSDSICHRASIAAATDEETRHSIERWEAEGGLGGT
jgi:hypothetical protein